MLSGGEAASYGCSTSWGAAAAYWGVASLWRVPLPRSPVMRPNPTNTPTPPTPATDTRDGLTQVMRQRNEGPWSYPRPSTAFELRINVEIELKSV